jgi:ATP-binding cassette subfamily B protein
MRSSRVLETPNAPINWKVFKQLLPYLLEFKGRVAFAMFCLVLAKVASIGLPFVLKAIIDGLDSPTTQAIAVPISLVLAYGAIRLVNTLLGEIRDTLFGRVTERAMRRLGLTVFRHLHRLDLGFHLERKTGGLSRDIDRGTSGISFLMRFMVFNIVPTFLEIIVVIIIFFAAYGFSFAAITFASIVLYIAFSVIATEKRTSFVKAEALADSSANTSAIDSLLNFETVKYFNNEKYEEDKYDQALAKWELARRSNRLSLFTLNGGQAFIISAGMTGMMLLAAINVYHSQMSLGDFVLINTFMMQMFIPLNFLGFVYREIRGSLANIERMFELLSTTPKIQNQEQAQPILVSNAEINFSNVKFGYDNKRPILDGISFTVPAGKKVAVVGDSGAGKSTLIKLLFRFYDLKDGSISIDNQCISQVTQESVRQNIAIVPQDTVLFNDTLINNVRYGRPDATEEETKKAIEMAHLSDFIKSLPDGYDTTVGERGLKLSGGEKQRVAIARAILKRSPILVFDEATSSLDSKSEQSILHAIKEVASNYTSLVIAHRLSTIVDADNIVVMSKGKVVEQGTHSELLTMDGLYKKLWYIQQESES